MINIMSPGAHRLKELKIHPRLLLGFYLAIPVAIILVFSDIFLFHGILRRALLSDPDNYALFTLLFTLPHILSSFLGFLDREYLTTYKTRLLKGVRYAFLGAILLPIVNLRLAFLVFAVYTMYHVFRQQSGIARSLMHGGNGTHRYWEWLGIILSLGVYVSIYTHYVPSISLIYLWFAIGAVYTYLGLIASKASRTRIGKYYFWMAHIAPIVSAVMLLIGYPIFAIAVPRVIHDLTGYTFYITHDYNRYAQTGANYLYRIFRSWQLPVTLLNPVISIGLALLFQLHISTNVYVVLTAMFLLHYYIEGFMWRRDSLHRRYISYTL